MQQQSARHPRPALRAALLAALNPRRPRRIRPWALVRRATSPCRTRAPPGLTLWRALSPLAGRLGECSCGVPQCRRRARPLSTVSLAHKPGVQAGGVAAFCPPAFPPSDMGGAEATRGLLPAGRRVCSAALLPTLALHPMTNPIPAHLLLLLARHRQVGRGLHVPARAGGGEVGIGLSCCAPAYVPGSCVAARRCPRAAPRAALFTQSGPARTCPAQGRSRHARLCTSWLCAPRRPPSFCVTGLSAQPNHSAAQHEAESKNEAPSTEAAWAAAAGRCRACKPWCHDKGTGRGSLPLRI